MEKKEFFDFVWWNETPEKGKHRFMSIDSFIYTLYGFSL